MMEEGKNEKPLILVTNDDGIEAKGIQMLADIAKQFGEVIVVAPREGQSGMSHAITVKVPLRSKKWANPKGINAYSVNGTPVDCVKICFNKLAPRRPNLVLSGINHGSNAAASVIYSGTLAAAMEGCVNQIPSIGFSLTAYEEDADFEAGRPFIEEIIKQTITNGLPPEVCLNVNIPTIPRSQIKGIKVCRQNKGYWKEEYEKRTDPMKRTYFWLTGEYLNLEPEATDTDEWALRNHYVSIVPVLTDLTAYNHLEQLQSRYYEMERLKGTPE